MVRGRKRCRCMEELTAQAHPRTIKMLGYWIAKQRMFRGKEERKGNSQQIKSVNEKSLLSGTIYNLQYLYKYVKFRFLINRLAYCNQVHLLFSLLTYAI